MAFRAVASVVIQKLTDMLTQESVINERNLVNELEKIKKALERMEGYFLDAESEAKRSNEDVKAWAEKYLKHLYHVEDAIETSASRFPLRKGSVIGKLVKLTFGLAFLKNYHLCRKMKKIRYEIDELNQIRPLMLENLSVSSTSLSYRNNYFEVADHLISVEEDEDHATDPYNDADSIKGRLAFEDHHPAMNGGSKLRIMSNASVFADRINQSRLIFNYSFDQDGLDFVAFKPDAISLAQKLIDIGSDGGSREVVSIVGVRGSGKTTLARAVFGNRQLKEHFQSCTAWVTASGTSSKATADLWLKLLRQISSSNDNGGGDPEHLKLKVRDILKDKRYLIVLDDVENLDMWDDLRSAFPDQQQQNGSKILLITCEKAVATRVDSHLLLKKLNDRVSWNLFLKKAGLVDYPEGDLKTRILQICNCLPLNIVLLGSLLSTKKPDMWGNLLYSQASWQTLDLISFCYNDLPDHLKLFLIYMVLFPKEFDIPVRRLKRLWLAEGFVKRSSRKSKENLPEDQEDVVNKYFDELVQRSLIQVSKLTSDGSPKRCRLLGVFHDHLIPKSQVISLFHVHNRYSCTSCDVADSVFNRRLVEYTDIKHCSLRSTNLGSLRSYLSFNIQKKDTPAMEVGKFLRSILSNGSRLLRVLDLEGVYKPSLPDNLGDFFHLRYLGLRWTFLETLPESIGRLSYLETLDIKHTLISTLPAFIWKMKHLKHLNANRNQLDLPRHSCSLMPQLITLSGISVDDKSLERDCLKSLVHLRELELTFQLSNSTELLCWISNLTAIQALRLRSKDDWGHPSKLFLRPLSNLAKLTHLTLLGNLEKLPSKDDFPPGLKVLTLAASQLKEDPMPILGELTNLTALGLLANSYLGREMNCRAGWFKELRVLKLWMLRKLEHWYVEEGAMGKLRELNIRYCDRLKMIPEELLQRINELTLTNMSPEFKKQPESTKPLLSITSNHYKFSTLPGEEGDGSSGISRNGHE